MKRLTRATAVLAVALAPLLAGAATPAARRATARGARHVRQPGVEELRRHLRRPVDHPRARRLVVRVRHLRPAARGRRPDSRRRSRSPARTTSRRWTYVGDAFSSSNRPSWAAADAGLWAPDIRYVDGQYRLYYVVTDTTLFDARAENDNAIGMATAPDPGRPLDRLRRPGRRPPCRATRRTRTTSSGPSTRARSPTATSSTCSTAPTTAGSTSRSSARTAARRSASRSRWPSTTSSRARTSVRHGGVLVPLRLGRQLLRRPDDRLLGPGRPVEEDHRPVRRPAGHAR